MDINTAALRLKQIEIIEVQIKHLRNEACGDQPETYATHCNESAERLIYAMLELSKGGDEPCHQNQNATNQNAAPTSDPSAAAQKEGA